MEDRTAGIIIIGDEILSGRTFDSNSNFIANKLIQIGVKLREIIIIPDEENIIISKVLKFHIQYTYVFTTGGIGPTHDDITSKSIAAAFQKKYTMHSEAYQILKKYYPKGEFNDGRKKMAMLPDRVKLIYNPISAAPGFIIKNVYVFPGVPEIMQKMFQNLLFDFKKGKPKKICTINTDLYESVIASGLSQIQDRYPDSSIGSYPYYDYQNKKSGVNIVISSWKRDSLNDINSNIIEMISLLGGESKIIK